MSHLQYFSYPGFGERSEVDAHYSQAVRIGDTIKISGQGGWDRLTEEISKDQNEEIDQAFANVEHAIQHAGSTGLDQVYQLRIFLLKWTDESVGFLVANLKKRFPKHRPLMTVVGVPKLYGTMTIEIEAEAHLGA